MNRLVVIALIAVWLGPTAVAQDEQAKVAEQLFKADAAVAASQFDAALDGYKKAWKLSGKSSPEACLGIARTYWTLGSFDDAAKACADGLKLPGVAEKLQASLHQTRGSALVALARKPTDKKLVEAEREFRDALAADPSLAVAHGNLGFVLVKTSRDEEGTRELKRYLEMAPGAPDARRVRCVLQNPRRAWDEFAPAFSFSARDGVRLSLDDFAGKTILLDFWGSWCRPCVAAAPGLVKLHRKLAEQPVVFVGIANDEEAAWKRFLDKNTMPWPQLLDATRQIARLFGIQAYPSYIVIDGDGVVRARITGYGPSTDTSLEREIAKTLK